MTRTAKEMGDLCDQYARSQITWGEFRRRLEALLAPAEHHAECPMAKPGPSERLWNCQCGPLFARALASPRIAGQEKKENP